MIKIKKIQTAPKYYVSLFALSYAVGSMGPAWAQNTRAVDLNYDTLAFFEEPLAEEFGDVTVLLSGLVDVPLTIDLDDSKSRTASLDFTGIFQIDAETQLPNRWTIGVAYFGRYDTMPFGKGDYTDNAAGFVKGSWGSVFGGNVTGTLREETRRLRGAGNAELAFDNILGEFRDAGGGYTGRYGPTTLGFVVDSDGNFDIGATFQRPILNKDYRLTLRYSDTEFLPETGILTFSSRAVTAVAELVYGSSLFDIGVGYEDLSSSPFDASRWYVSIGARHKKGALTISTEGHFGQTDSDSETSASLGVQYDVARGLSLNFGVNYQDAQLDVDGLRILDKKETTAVFSFRYGF